VSSQADLGDRYGAARPWRRRGVIVASALLAVAFLAWLAWTAWSASTPQVESDLVSYKVEGEHAASAKVQVQLRDDDVEAACLLRAYAEDHAVVGELSFKPRPGQSQPVKETVRTERRATSVTLVGCTAAGQTRPR